MTIRYRTTCYPCNYWCMWRLCGSSRRRREPPGVKPRWHLQYPFGNRLMTIRAVRALFFERLAISSSAVQVMRVREFASRASNYSVQGWNFPVISWK